MWSPLQGGDQGKEEYTFHVASNLFSDAQERGVGRQTHEQNHLEPLVFYAETFTRPRLFLPA